VNVIIEDFVKTVIDVHKFKEVTEHSYRTALQSLFSKLDQSLTVVNEPRRIACGAPDLVIARGEIPIGYVEAKDLSEGLRNMKGRNKTQQENYCAALPNLIYTNCYDWDFYRNKKLIASVSIGTFHDSLSPKADQYATLENLLRDFIAQHPQTITSPQVLAEMMAGKAVLIKDIFLNALLQDQKEKQDTELMVHYKTFKNLLLHDIKLADFADIYAETIAYGMFAARLHDPDLDTFSRQEALELLPKSNPFLRKLFSFIAGPDLDDRIAWIIDDLSSVFQAADVKKLLEGFGRLTGQTDPFLHFYETFLAAYNPAKRKARGVWYTPEPVVNFIVRAVDEVLQKEFGLADGLADTSKIGIDWDTGQTDKKGKPISVKKDVHRVQILDPATGTGTFLAEVIKQIAPRVKDMAPGMWSQYIEDELIPRLHGFEILMASYAMCHMKLDMILAEMGYKPTGTPPRLSVYLTNSLEEGEREVRDLFMGRWLSQEASEASTIKRQAPIMCVIGNPPYSGESSNKGDWIMNLMDAYKKEPGGEEKLKERNPKWINDDYVKFLRLAEHLIEKNGEGVLGFITNHGYLDNPTFRGMRWHLLNTFDTLYVIDLHGNSKKKEVTPDGKPDKNVFDIQQGVSIIIGAKKRRKPGDKSPKPLSQVFHSELWGDRESKYSALLHTGLTGSLWQPLSPPAPQYSLTRRNYDLESAYLEGFSIQEFMPVNSVGIVTARDALTIDIDKNALWQRVQHFVALTPEAARQKYSLGNDVQDWAVSTAQADAQAHLSEDRLTSIAYRPFDTRWTFYTGTSRGFQCRPRSEVMRQMTAGNNIGIATARSNKNPTLDHFFVTKFMTEAKFAESSTQSAVFPLYLYSDNQEIDRINRVNFDETLYERVQEIAKDQVRGTPDEVSIFDYIYGVLHCPAYRRTYAEFLKIDFPRIPWPASPGEFWDVSSKGSQLRKLHLMEPTAIGSTPFPFTGDGNYVVDKPRFEDGKVWINATQYFDKAPAVSWGFYIGGYQPAQKWLKDRKGRKLSLDDVKHYQKILKILSETDRIMGQINMTLKQDEITDEALR